MRCAAALLGVALAVMPAACSDDGESGPPRSQAESGDSIVGDADPPTSKAESGDSMVGPLEDKSPIVVVGSDTGIAYFIGSVERDGVWKTSSESYALDASTGEWAEIASPPIEQTLNRAVGASNGDGVFLVARDCAVPPDSDNFFCGGDEKTVGLHYDPEADRWTTFPLPDDATDEIPHPASGVPGDSGVLYWRFGELGGTLRIAVLPLDTRSLRWGRPDDTFSLQADVCAVGDTLVGVTAGLLPRLVIAPLDADATTEEIQGLGDLNSDDRLRPFCTESHVLVGPSANVDVPVGPPLVMRPMSENSWSEVPPPPGEYERARVIVESRDRLFSASLPVTLDENGIHQFIEPEPVLAFNPASATWASVDAVPYETYFSGLVSVDPHTVVIYPDYVREATPVVVRRIP